MLLNAYNPRSKLQVKTTCVDQPRYPVIDAHNHLGGLFGENWLERPLPALIEVLDASGVRCIVDLDGGWGEAILRRHLEYFKHNAPDRFVHFGGVDWSQWAVMGDEFPGWAASRLEEQAAWGAQGLKVWKGFGLNVLDHRAQLVRVDDPRLDPLWHEAARLCIPVLIHVADPVAFFDPLDPTNERWEELQAHPDWHFPSPPYPPFKTIVDGLANLVTRHQATTFIGAHAGCYAENLGWVGSLLDRCPNFYVDIAARLGELGRQPYTARRFLIQYADRVLFGTDLTPDLEMYRLHYRFLESDDEYFDYDLVQPPPQGRWQIYGVHLPEEVLRKIYHENARRVLKLTHYKQ